MQGERIYTRGGKVVWPSERVSLLKRLWADRLTAEQIARKLTRVFGDPITRNAVVGKLNRPGLSWKRIGPLIALRAR
jgi:hypothetical protein